MQTANHQLRFLEKSLKKRTFQLLGYIIPLSIFFAVALGVIYSITCGACKEGSDPEYWVNQLVSGSSSRNSEARRRLRAIGKEAVPAIINAAQAHPNVSTLWLC